MTNQEIENLIQEKKNQVRTLNREIRELEKQHSLLSQRYEIAIVTIRTCKATTKGAFQSILEDKPIKVYLKPQKAFSNRQKAKDYAYTLRNQIHKGLIKFHGARYSHIAMLDKTKENYQVVWTC